MSTTIGLLLPLIGTMLGAAFVFFMKKDMSPRVQKSPSSPCRCVPKATARDVSSSSDRSAASSGEHSNLSTIGFAIGFVLMMVLDVVMG